MKLNWDYDTLVYDKCQGFKARQVLCFKMHVHLVFLTKYRRGVLDGDAISQPGTTFVMDAFRICYHGFYLVRHWLTM
jgi:hypothetical protein